MIATALAAAGVEFTRCGDLAGAVAAAAREARDGRRRRALAGVCELRPVPNYEHRGEEFGKLVQKLQG